jgi:hypothetical protein
MQLAWVKNSKYIKNYVYFVRLLTEKLGKNEEIASRCCQNELQSSLMTLKKCRDAN